VGRLPPRHRPPTLARLLELLPAAAALALLLLVRHSGLTEQLNLFAYDLALQLRPTPSGASTPIRIIGIDEQDLALYGPQVPDGLVAKAVQRLDRIGVRAIGLDLFCGQAVGFGWQALRQEAANNPRLVSIYFELDGKTAIPGTPSNRQANADLYIDPQDGVLRRDVLQVSEGPQAASVSLPLRLLRIARGRNDSQRKPQLHRTSTPLLTAGGGGYLPGSGVTAPAYRQRMLPFHQPGSFRTWPLRSLLKDPPPKELIRQLRSSIVFIGVVAPSSKDTFAVPFSSWRTGQRRFEVPGVEIHAHRLAALLADDAGTRLGVQAAPAAVNALILALGVGAGLLVGEGIASLRRAVLLGVLGLTLGVVSVATALAMGVWVDGALPLLAFLLVAAASWLRRGGYLQIKSLQLERQNQQTRTVFDRFVSRNVAEALLDTEDSQAGQQQQRHVTVLISDLRGFSLISAEHSPNEVMQMLNNYLDVMIEVVENFGGTIDEVQGDALLVLFGAPRPQPNHAEAAIACAIQMQLAMERVNSIHRQQKLPELAMGIGICSGDVIVGTIGSGRRSKYAAVGEAVNLASRIEALTVGGEIFAAKATVRSVRAELRIDGQHHWQVKGKTQPLQVFSISAIAGAYKLALPCHTSIPRPLRKHLQVTYQPIRTKTKQGPPREACITHLAADEAWLEPQAVDLLPFDDLVLRVVGHPGDVYAKVREGTSTSGTRIVFSSIPAEFRAWIDGLGSE
jgi:adenylate cyclase